MFNNILVSFSTKSKNKIMVFDSADYTSEIMSLKKYQLLSNIVDIVSLENESILFNKMLHNEETVIIRNDKDISKFQKSLIWDKLNNVRLCNISDISDMNSMLWGIDLDSLDLEYFFTNNITNMKLMFNNAAIKTIKNLNFDTSNISDMSYMFSHFSTSVLDLHNLDLSCVYNLKCMFTNCYCKILDLSGFNPEFKSHNLDCIFKESVIGVLNLSDFNNLKLFSGSCIKDMFIRCKVNILILPIGTNNIEELMPDCVIGEYKYV